MCLFDSAVTTVAVVVTMCRAVGGATPPIRVRLSTTLLSALQRAFGVTVTLRLRGFLVRFASFTSLRGLADHTGARRRAWFLSSEIKKGGLAAVVSARNTRLELYRFSHESEN